MKEPRFKVGDKVTYKSKRKCKDSFGRKNYYHGGLSSGGYKGTILNYKGFNANMDCYEITVTSRCDGSYNMLESEFEEYDVVTSNNDLFPIY